MKKSFGVVIVMVALVFSFSLLAEVAWALKNVCPRCGLVIENLDLTNCYRCGKVINQCLICGTVNPIKNDHCSKCNASLAESRLKGTISSETREELKIGESPRAKIEVELEQLKQGAAKEGGLTPEMGARQVQLLTAMGWWSEANTVAIDFASRFPNASETAQVAADRVIALRNLSFLAWQDGDLEAAKEYLKTGLSIDPKDVATLNFQKKVEATK